MTEVIVHNDAISLADRSHYPSEGKGSSELTHWFTMNRNSTYSTPYVWVRYRVGLLSCGFVIVWVSCRVGLLSHLVHQRPSGRAKQSFDAACHTNFVRLIVINNIRRCVILSLKKAIIEVGKSWQFGLVICERVEVFSMV